MESNIIKHHMKKSQLTCLHFGLWLTLSSSAFSATTLLQGGNVNVAGGWSNGLPTDLNPGTITVDGVINASTVSYTGSETITHTAGTITDSAAASQWFNYVGAGTWNTSGGGITSRVIQANNSTINLSGGLFSSAASTNGQIGVVNAGILNISGTAILDATGLGNGFVLASGTGTIDFAPSWTGYFTAPRMNNATTTIDWQTLLVNNPRFTYNGSGITQPIYTQSFQTSGINGQTLRLIPEPSAALLGALGLLPLLRRRRVQ